MKKIFVIFLLIALFISVIAEENQELNNEHYMMAVLWAQTSAEYAALTHQAYNIAKLRLDEILQKDWQKPLAIIADIDETVLANAAYNARGVVQEQTYPADFYEYIAQASGKAIPGALEFMKYAKARGCEIFYVTNRRVRGKAGTVANLQKLAFPDADSSHVFMKVDVSSKEPRRQNIAKDYEIALLLGDNLNDFAKIYEKKSIAERKVWVEKQKQMFGRKFIIFPNPMHGAWKKALYEYRSGLSDEEQKLESLKYLKTWK